MPTLYVENFPADLYAALRARARSNGGSIAAETVAAIRASVPTAAELRRRRALLRKMQQWQSRAARAAGAPTAEEMIREDRGR